MAHKELFLALSMIAAALPVSAANSQQTPTAEAPAGTPETRYCLRVEPATGSRIETIHCWTRWEWAEQGVDVDLEWAKEGVTVLG